MSVQGEEKPRASINDEKEKPIGKKVSIGDGKSRKVSIGDEKSPRTDAEGFRANSVSLEQHGRSWPTRGDRGH